MATGGICGDEYKQRGLATHQRYCDEAPAADADDDDFAEPELETDSSPTAVDEDSGIVGEDGLSECQVDAGLTTHP